MEVRKPCVNIDNCEICSFAKENEGITHTNTLIYLVESIPVVVITKYPAARRIKRLYNIDDNGYLISYFTDPQYRRRGHASRAVRDFVKRQHLNVYASIYEDNYASISTAVKAGMIKQHEGLWEGKKVCLYK